MTVFPQFIVGSTAGGGGGGKFYKSLTGAGELTTPGALTQHGNLSIVEATLFTIVFKTTPTHGTFKATFTTPLVTLRASRSYLQLASTNGIRFTVTPGGGFTVTHSITFQNTAPTNLWHIFTPTTTHTGGMKFTGRNLLLNPSRDLGFFGVQAGQQSVTGSRGGNAALASVLTALANYGLILNTTTP